MNYEKKYKEALERAKIAYKDTDRHLKAVLERIFPELKESEDERVRKKIIEYMKTGTYNKDYIRYADRYSYEIWRKLMDNFKNIKDYHIGCNEVSDIVLNAIIDTLNWLEKGGDKNKVSKHVEAINEEKVDDANKVEPKDYNSIVPHFGKTIDKVEPKFKVGDWITNGATKPAQISSIEDDMYYTHNNTIGGDIKSIDKEYHLWTIQDAKDGDVLTTKRGNLFINWLKSLKQRCTWKLSEELIKALHDLNLTGNISYGGQGQILIELYNNLKKLTE